MQVTETLNEGLKRKLSLVIPKNDLTDRLQVRLGELKNQANIKGFRPGKVPESYLKKVYGKSAMAECIANRLLTESKSEDATIFRLSNRVRGGGKVGEMTKLLAQALQHVTHSVGKTRRAVLVIDEGDSIAAARSQEHSHHEDKVAVNTLIQGIDDLRSYKGRIVVILCTNRLSVLDPALLRRAAIIDRFERPSDAERRQLLEMDLNGLGLAAAQFAELVQLTGPTKEAPGWTYSDFRTRFYPATVAMAFPDRPLRFDDLRDTAARMTGSRVMEDR